MASTVSKRQQARNERQLQDLLHNVSGNDRCADCSTNNPGWASWSLGVFLCVRCASLHRKLGTHVSKVKSLSMDSWSVDQVENMKKVGNLKSNAIYNPKNVQPDIPIDADEVDGAMERYIRQKYELRTLSTNKPAIKQNTGSTGTGSWNEEPPPLPPKPKRFPFSFRSASSNVPKARQDRITPPLSPTYSMGNRSPTDYGPDPPKKDKPSQVFGMKITSVSNNFDQKLSHLQDMGFNDPKRNSEILKSSNGNLDKAVETLARLGEGSKPAPLPRTLTPVSMGSTGGVGISVDKTRLEEKKLPDNPWEVKQEPAQRSASLPVAQASVPPRSQSADPISNSWNPFLSQTPQSQPQQTLQSSFQNLSVSHTGPTQQQQQPQQSFQQPPVPQIPQQYQNNPFQQPQQIQSNPWQQQVLPQQPYPGSATITQPQPFQSQPTAAPQFNQPGNPFLQTSRTLSASPSSPWTAQQPAPIPQQSNPWAPQVQPVAPVAQQPMNPFGQPPAMPPVQQQQQQNIFQQPTTASPPPMMSGQQGYFSQQDQQQQKQPQQTQFMPNQQPQPTQPIGQNPWQQPAQMQPQQTVIPQQQQQFQQPLQYGQQPFQSQPIRHDKSSILALYNMPNLAPRQPLQTLQEDPNAVPQAVPPQRSVTLPVQQGMGGMNSNPWMATGPPPTTQGPRHVSNESVDFVGMGAGGRHSPDAFAGLSAQYMR